MDGEKQGQVEIRFSKADDGFELAQLSLQVWNITLRSIVPDGFLSRFELHAQTQKYTERATDPHWIFLVACKEQKIVGMIGAKANDAEPMQFEKQIKAMYVHPECQRQGIGSMLIGRMFEELRAHKVKGVMLWCISSNQPAATFYEKHGGRRIENITPPSEYSAMPHVVYAWHSLPDG